VRFALGEKQRKDMKRKGAKCAIWIMRIRRAFHVQSAMCGIPAFVTCFVGSSFMLESTAVHQTHARCVLQYLCQLFLFITGASLQPLPHACMPDSHMCIPDSHMCIPDRQKCIPTSDYMQIGILLLCDNSVGCSHHSCDCCCRKAASLSGSGSQASSTTPS